VKRYKGVHQFHSGTAMGDAITNQMLQLQVVLQEMGFHSEIFAEHIPPALIGKILNIHHYLGSDSELLLVHHSNGHDAFEEVLALPNDIVAVYHNVTPEEYFADEGVRRYIQLGREQLRLLAQRALFGVAVSNFNRREMLAAGFRRVEVLPVRVDFSEFAQHGRHAASDDWLFVGRLVGNKCQHELVTAFSLFVRSFESDARLVLVGDLSDEEYVGVVRAEAARRGVTDRVALLGKVSDRQLRSAFGGAGVFVSMSEHEGFGVPILEAMAAGVPVVAFGAAAIPETMGGAGVLLRDKEPALLAATVRAVLSDPDLRDRLVERQFTRVGQVGTFEIRRLLGRIVDRAAGSEPPLEVQVQGPFETSYSLALMNRKLAVGLSRSSERAVSIYATEGPGDYVPDEADLAKVPEATALYRRATQVPFPDVVIRQMYPPRVIDTPGGITCEYFGWEESLVPPEMVEDFNRYLDGIGVMSEFVKEVLRDSGVHVPICVVGNGVEAPDPTATTTAPEVEGLRAFRFLHVSSGFPRKGVDVLLGAFFDAFDGSDDVTLILKTFPNPHNEVGAILERLRSTHPNPPDVRWIDRDLDAREIEGLYRLARCYVHPARGEGFGLPVAEAMAGGIPVITLAYSGLADFVSEDTAATIPFTLEPAQSHFDIEGSLWAEPDPAKLAEEMQQMAADPRSPIVTERVRKAKELVTTRFSWEAAVARWDRFLSDLEDGSGALDVAMVTSWNTRCGIAENSRYLVGHSRGGIDYEIFGEVDIEPLDPIAELGVVRTWKNRWEPDLDALEAALRLSTAEVVHFQFNFGFFEFGRMAELIERLLDDKGVVVTLHRTLDYDDRGDLLSLRQIRDTLAKVDRLIVHQEVDASYLAEMGLVDNVTIIPIGAAPPPSVSPAEAREYLRIGSRPLVGTFGFLLPHKGTLELVEAVDALRTEIPDILCLALCASYPNIESKEYEALLRQEIVVRGMEDNVMLIADYLPDDVARTLLRAADAIVLPYRNTGESSSAALRFVLPLERAIVVTDEPIFADSREVVLTVDRTDPVGLESALRRILLDKSLQDELAGRAARRTRSLRWDRVVADHRDVYLAAKGSGRSRRDRGRSATGRPRWISSRLTPSLP
jgi:glycosyltransferase involved in cell wall biosynthesis